MRVSAETKAFVTMQAARLTAKPFAPTDPEAIREIARTLLECAEDMGHAKVIVDAVMSEEGRFPEPASLRRIAWESRQMCQRPDPFCPECSGSGFISAMRGNYSCASRCTCWGSRPVANLPWMEASA